MNNVPPEEGSSYPPTQPYAAAFVVQPATSGFAIAGLVCSILGLLTACAILPSALGIVFSGIGLPGARRGETRGKGLAVAGLILGILGVLAGAAFWVIFTLSPSNAPVKGTELDPSYDAKLRTLGIVQPAERIEMFYSAGFLSIEEGGVLITDRRLVVYDEDLSIESCELADIRAIEFTPAANVFDEGWFGVEPEEGDEIYFVITGMEGADKQFERFFRRQVTEARESGGKSPPASVLSDAGEEK